ncbi:MAG TPA: hypothetical protein VK927_09400 [Adhaeribacter sp.]|nr:hypothetical protein [Adhaeribacter sp.]
MKRFIEVRKNRPEDQEAISKWLVTCQTNNMPVIIVYYDQDTAYISASILNLVNSSAYEVAVDGDGLDKKFSALGLAENGFAINYWNHNGRFFTFDGIPKNKAPEVATRIFDILDHSITLNHPDDRG